MSVLKVTYADLSHASKYTKKTANELDNYASKMEGGVARKISSISGGQSNRTSTALYETQLKIAELRAKSDKLNNYANRIEQFENSVKETDNKVAKRIKAISATFAKDNGFKIGKVSAFFEALAVNTVNSTSLGRWVKDVYNKAEDKTNDLKTEIKHWFKTGGGRYIIDVVGSVLNFTVAAVVAVVAVTVAIAAVTFGSVIIAVAAVVIATIEAANLISNARNTKKALKKNKDDPAWAYRYGNTDTLSDSLRLEGNDKAANIVDVTYVAASCVLVVDGIYNLGKMVISKSSSIKAFITNKKDTFKIFRYNKDIGKQVVNGTGDAERQLLSSSEWNEYFKQTYGSKNVEWVTENKASFGSRKLLEGHFDKHGSEFGGIYSTADEYLQGAKDVMNNGYKVQYDYNVTDKWGMKVPEKRTGYMRFMGNNRKGEAKFEFVGTNNRGDITTYHTESGKTLWKLLNGSNADKTINPIK